jgi:hypothetical protein
MRLDPDLPLSLNNLSMNSHGLRAKSTNAYCNAYCNVYCNASSSYDLIQLEVATRIPGALMSVQLTSEEAMELFAYLDRDPNLPPFLLSVANKLKFSLTSRACVFTPCRNNVCYYKSSV